MLAAEPDVVEDARVARLIKSDLIDLDTRLMAAPYEIGAETPVSATCFRLEQLRAEMELGSTVGPIASQMCEQLRRNHFAIVLPDEAGQAALHGVWQAARDFFDLTADDKESIAGRMRKAEGNVGVIGWGTMPDDNEFLEMRVAAGGQVVPGGLDTHIPGFSAATNAARKELFALSRTVVGAAESYVGLQKGGLRNLLDDGSQLGEGQWSSTQHRLCLYHADTNVPFEAHTDTTFLTLIPCSAIAGLEVWTAQSGWVRPEQHAESAGAVIVMPGEFLQVLTGGMLPAAVHRVTRFASDLHAADHTAKGTSRLSGPLLVRGVKETVIDASSLLEQTPQQDYSADTLHLHQTLTRLQGVSLYDLHRVLVHPPPLDSL